MARAAGGADGGDKDPRGRAGIDMAASHATPQAPLALRPIAFTPWDVVLIAEKDMLGIMPSRLCAPGLRKSPT